MNREELLDTAHKAGFEVTLYFGASIDLERFANLLIERCAMVCEARARAVASGALGSRAEQFAEAIACTDAIRELAGTACAFIGKPHK